MKVQERGRILKFFIMVFNSICTIVGLVILGCGLWILFDKSNFILTISDEESIRTIASGLFVIGLIVTGICILGYIGTVKEIRCFTVMHIIFLLPVFFGIVFVTSVLLMNKDVIAEALITEVDKIIFFYGNETADEIMKIKWMLLDAVQHYKACCGRVSYIQWKSNIILSSLSESNVYPCSCFNTSICVSLSNSGMQRFGIGSDVYQTGCEKSIEDWLWKNGITIVGMAIGLASLQVVQIALGILFYQNSGRKRKRVHTERTLVFQEASLESSTV